MASHAGDRLERGVSIGLARESPAQALAGGCLGQMHARLADGTGQHVAPLLAEAYARAAGVARAAADSAAAESLAASIYAAEVVILLAAEAELEAADTRVAATALADARSEPYAVAAFELDRKSVV